VLGAHISDVNQLVYDEGTDFTTSKDGNGVLVVQPLNDDAHNAYLILQHAVNRLNTALNLPTVSEDGVLRHPLFLSLFQIANSAQVVSKATTFIDGLKANGTFNTFLQLGPFRNAKLSLGPDLTKFVNDQILDLGKRARLWGSLLSALADTVWWSTLSNATTPVVPRTSKLPLVIAATIGVAIGIGTMVTVFAIRRRAS